MRHSSPCLEKLNRLDWATALTGISHGVRIGIRANHPEVLDQLVKRLPPRWKPLSSTSVDCLYSVIKGGLDARQRGVRRFHLAYAGARQIARSFDFGDVLRELESDFHRCVAEKARRWIFVHAGVVAWRGQAIVIPGATQSGKTSLVAALVRAGAVYFSDEYAVFDARGRVHPYPKPLSIRSNGEPSRCAPSELGATVGTRSLPVGLVVLTKFSPGARWRPVALSQGQAVLAMMSHALCARTRPAAALATLARATAPAAAIKTLRGEAEGVASSVAKASFASTSQGEAASWR